MKMRVHQLAKEFGTSSESILKMLWGRGYSVRSASSTVDRFAVEWLRFEFTVDQPVPEPPAPNERVRALGRQRVRLPDYDWGTLRAWRRPAPVPLTFTSRGPTARSMRAVAVYGSKPSELAGLDVPSIHEGLRGSPYSLPSEQTEYLVSNFLPRVAALSIRARREAQRVNQARAATLRRITRSTEIYESNQIEGLGPDLSTTDRVLHENELHRRADVSIARQACQGTVGTAQGRS